VIAAARGRHSSAPLKAPRPASISPDDVSSFSRSSFTHRLGALVALGVCLFVLAWGGSRPAAAHGPQRHSPAPGRVKAPPATSQLLDLRVSVGLVPGTGAALSYRGTFTGPPLGRGKVSLQSMLGGGDATVTYVLSTSQGTISGAGAVTLSYNGSIITYHGTASITKGTGAYRTIQSSGLTVSGSGGLNPQKVTLRLTGKITI
jgi:hypothetical protein